MKIVLLLLMVTILFGCSTTKYRTNTLSSYSQAPVIEDWKSTLQIDGATARLSAKSGPFENVTLQYSDELNARTVYKYADYLYVSEIRYSTNSVLYVKVSGIAMGIWPETLIIPFDLKKRARLKLLKIKECGQQPAPDYRREAAPQSDP